jgi:hypothetical protein
MPSGMFMQLLAYGSPLSEKEKKERNLLWNGKRDILLRHCKYNNLVEIQKICDNDLMKKIWPNIFTQSCQYGHMEIAEWIWHVRKVGTDLDKDDELALIDAFYECCLNNQIHIAKWIHQIYSRAYFSNRRTYVFNYCCERGYLEIAQFLYSIESDFEKNHDWEANHNLHYTFMMACKYGQLKVVKWLYSIKNNIDIQFDTKGCTEEIIEWLKSLP